MSNSTPEQKRNWESRNKHRLPKIRRDTKLRRFYGITPERFEEMYYKEQKQCCAVCITPFLNESEAYVDHDHSSKWVRGLLCHQCNVAIGLLRDDPKVISNAAEYVVSNATPTEFKWAPIPTAKRVYSEETKEVIRRTHANNTYRKGAIPWNKGISTKKESTQCQIPQSL